MGQTGHTTRNFQSATPTFARAPLFFVSSSSAVRVELCSLKLLDIERIKRITNVSVVNSPGALLGSTRSCKLYIKVVDTLSFWSFYFTFSLFLVVFVGLFAFLQNLISTLNLLIQQRFVAFSAYCRH